MLITSKDITYNKFPLDAAMKYRGVEDWSLSENVYQMIVNTFGTPDVDLMASMQNFNIIWRRIDPV